ncbi:2-amino-4-hydroxy-6-hydroxymethyldihydropteridine diphosphokinase [Microbacterium terrisoli]|jgi:2-amino-4-hydroxy-6-hydroxymethyldihydropteridine diphosphokinase|uniref:2-amino-4-hydroxy-6- hydroxymethyldihydropteridine diphosphokinase n=1 Tax=Microbacterium terrisoli TaxID=3242192 RepID=UPI0028065886|nr:2-amino-4-hydroxy-6-hydroxymethyldihydropteridine diphosphokinase [Microbacterium protaetiae]
MSRRLAQGFTPASAAGAPAVVALGANLGDRHATMDAAIAELRALPLTTDVRVAEPITSVAIKLDGPDVDAPQYVNTVAVLTTRLAPSVLLDALHEIEQRHGRVRLERWGDRTLDLDIVAYGDVRSDDPDLTLPHPRAAERLFVLEPWLAVDSDAVLPGVGRVNALVAALQGPDS